MVVFVKYYLATNLLLLMSVSILFLTLRVNRLWQRRVSFAHLLKFSYALLVMSLTLPWLLIQTFEAKIWQPQAQVWSSLGARNLFSQSSSTDFPRAAISVGSMIKPVQLDLLTFAFFSALGIGILIVGIRLLKDTYLLKVILKESFTLKKIGKVSVLASNKITIPFSAWIPNRSMIVVPQHLLEHFEKLKLVMRHEIQHHRQNDTRWIYFMQIIKAFCFWNPFAYLIQNQIAQLQEVACDEALTGHQNFSSEAYCDCLLWVAQNSVRNRRHLVGTAGFTGGSAIKLLKWRIEEMRMVRKRQASGLIIVLIGIVASVILATGAIATNSSIQDRRISYEDAMKLVANTKSNDYPLIVNDEVLEQLNRYLGTPDGREFISKSIDRMRTYESMISEKLNTKNLPRELLAVPIVESGYRNLPHNGNPAHGAGIWMFIASTARNFGLQVDFEVDERLNVTLETDAAVSAFVALHAEFNDWGLALLGYNAGQGTVRRGIQQTGSRDVWELIRNGYGNDPHYVASVVAATLIMNNPDSLK